MKQSSIARSFLILAVSWAANPVWSAPVLLRGHLGDFVRASLSRDGQLGLSVSRDRVLVWRVTDGSIVQSIRPPRAHMIGTAELSPSGKFVVVDAVYTGADNTAYKALTVYSLPAGGLVMTAKAKALYDDFGRARATLAITSDDRLLAARTELKKGTGLSTWEIPTGRPLGQFAIAHTQGHFDQQGIAYLHVESGWVLFNLRTGKEVTVRGSYHPAICAMDPSGGRLIVHSLSEVKGERGLRLWNGQAWEGGLDIGEAEAEAVRFSSDGKRILVLTRKDWIEFDAATRKPIGRVAVTESLGTHWASDERNGRFLLIKDKEVRLWDRNRQLWSLRDPVVRVTSLSFAPSGTVVVGYADGNVRLWGFPGQPVLLSVKVPGVRAGHVPEIDAAALSASGQRLVTAIGEDEAFVQDTQSGRTLYSLAGHYRSQRVRAVAFAPGDRSLATAASDNTIRFWSVETGKQERVLEDESYESNGGGEVILFDPRQRFVLSPSSTQGLRFWNLKSGEYLFNLKHPGDDGQPAAAAFSPDGRQVASALEATVSIWDVDRRTVVRQWSASENPDRVSPGMPDAITQVAWSRRGILAVALNDTIQFWSADAKRVGRILSASAVRNIVFGADGRIIASMDEDGLVRLWRVPDGSLLATLVGLPGGGLVLAGDGRFDASEGGMRTVLAFPTKGGLAQRSSDYDRFRSVGLFAAVLKGER